MLAENHLKWYNAKLREIFTQDEIKLIMQKSDWKGLWQIIYTWLWILFAFAIVYFFPKWYVIIVSLFILGGKQLACAIIMHDCSHDGLFKTKKLNDFFGNWFGAFPIIQNLDQYRPYHRDHHIYTGLDNDPDLSLTKGYPTTLISMFRKFFRDLSGATGVKGQLGVIAMHLGILQYNLGGKIVWLHQKINSWENLKASFHHLIGPFVSNVIIFLLCWLSGMPSLYLLWVVALLTTYNFCLRVRSISEHSIVTDRTNPHKNTRTTYANFFAQILFAPLHVNFHAEHHLCMGAPSYNLPLIHRFLLSRGYYQEGELCASYWEVVKKAVLKK